MSNKWSFFGILFPEKVKFDYDGMRGVDLQSILFVHLISLTGVLLLHHLHDHSHWTWDLAEEHSWYTLDSSGNGYFTNIGLKFVFQPEAESCYILFW